MVLGDPQSYTVGGERIHIHVAVALGGDGAGYAGPARRGVGVGLCIFPAALVHILDIFKLLTDFCAHQSQLLSAERHTWQKQSALKKAHDNLPVFDCLKNHGNGYSVTSSVELLPSPLRADPAGELPMDKADTAAEERMLSREAERLEEAGEAGTSRGEEVDMVERLEA